MRFGFLRPALLAALGGMALAACHSYQNISPNYIGMKLTPTGYEDTIYTPGQVDIGTTSQAGEGNQLVLIQRSGVEVKEQFLGKEGNKDAADHRCLTQRPEPDDARCQTRVGATGLLDATRQEGSEDPLHAREPDADAGQRPDPGALGRVGL